MPNVGLGLSAMRSEKALTSFVGRRSELVQVRRILAAHRLVTLLGAAGGGKTRLAIELARRARRPTEIVALVELSSVASDDQVDAAISASFGLVPGDGETREELAAWLGGRPALLILDNCEHVRRASADLTAALLARCPRLRILATSREALGVEGECTWQVPALSLPAAGKWRRSDAVTLFAERAREVLPTFAISTTNAEAVMEICRAMEGMPLAIELAASRLRDLTFGDVVRGLSERLALLEPPRGARAGRHHTMRAAIAWSHGLLDEGERRVFRRLAVFRGGFDSDAAAAVCADDSLPAPDVVRVVSGLVDRSLVQLTGSGEQQRYALLEVVREYASERLVESREEDLVRARQAAFIADLFDAFGPHRQAHREEALGRIFAAGANVGGAMEWLLEKDLPRARQALGKAWLAYVFLRPGVDPAEIERWLSTALEADESADGLRARMLIGLSQRRFGRGEPRSSETAAAEALQIAADLNDGHAVAGAHQRLAISRLAEGDLAGGLAHLDQAISHYRTTNMAGCAWGLAQRGSARGSSGDLTGARADFAEALAICDAHPHVPRLRAVVRTLQGEHLVRTGEHAAGRAAFTDSLQVYTKYGAEVPVARALHGLARVAAREGQTERSLRLAGAAAGVRARTGDTWPPSIDDTALAALERRMGRRAEALRSEGRALSVADAVSYALGEMRTVDGLLSPRERDVASLVAEGLTSREIGRRLRITERTAETHVEHILVKLGLRSRVQIARWVVEEGPQRAATS